MQSYNNTSKKISDTSKNGKGGDISLAFSSMGKLKMVVTFGFFCFCFVDALIDKAIKGEGIYSIIYLENW